MTDLEALHRAVLLTPDDDLPRLVLADALDMTGDPKGAERAAFIRLHVEYAREHRKTYRARLERKIRDAMKGVVPFRAWPWLNEILDGTRFGLTVDGWRYAIGGAAGRVHVRRGFVERVECSPHTSGFICATSSSTQPTSSPAGRSSGSSCSTATRSTTRR